MHLGDRLVFQIICLILLLEYSSLKGFFSLCELTLPSDSHHSGYFFIAINLYPSDSLDSCKTKLETHSRI